MDLPTDLAHLPHDVLDILCLHLARPRLREDGLCRLGATCWALRRVALGADAAWDRQAVMRYSHPVRLGIAQEHLELHDCVDWALSITAVEGRAAFSRPTIGRLAEAPQLSGGHGNYQRLLAARDALRAHLRPIEADITALPFRVDLLAVPSNEFLEDPGWGVMHALYRKGGAGLREWVAGVPMNARGTRLRAGRTLVSPAFDFAGADWLCHAVGIAWGGGGACRWDTHLRMQLMLCCECFAEAARRGATSVAVPAISAGKRGFPAAAVAGIAAAVAAREILASAEPSASRLTVHLVGFGAENHARMFEAAARLVATKLAPEPAAHGPRAL